MEKARAPRYKGLAPTLDACNYARARALVLLRLLYYTTFHAYVTPV